MLSARGAPYLLDSTLPTPRCLPAPLSLTLRLKDGIPRLVIESYLRTSVRFLLKVHTFPLFNRDFTPKFVIVYPKP